MSKNLGYITINKIYLHKNIEEKMKNLSFLLHLQSCL